MNLFNSVTSLSSLSEPKHLSIFMRMAFSSCKLYLPTKFLLPIFLILLSPNHFLVRGGSSQGTQPIVDGLSWDFYDTVCPNLESIIREHLRIVLKEDVSQAAGFLHMYLQDCFSQGCDASVLLKGPSPSLRPLVLKAISDLGNIVRKECGRVVSCADIITIATRDAIYLAGGPDYAVPLGRRDSKTIQTIKDTTKLPFPSTSSDTSAILGYFEQINWDATDAVAISGAHTFGLSHCSNFNFRLYPNLDPTMDRRYATLLRETCEPCSISMVALDIRSPNRFDNKYYVNLMNRQGLFTSDQTLYDDVRTRDIVTSFATNQSLFFEKFVHVIVKMGQMGVLTGEQGEIRDDCSALGLDNIASVTHEFGAPSS
ncbi:hypothetical protein Leryth_023938 [Lithospermum erythrorhizon]|nr:hypothetical protein Leryth_023938 [Lithospermum erythrorhizon]